MRPILALTVFPVFASIFGPSVDVKITPAIKEYCHIVRFPQGWAMMPFIENGDVLGTVTPLQYVYESAYEFRVPGVLRTRFLVRGVDKSYGKNHYHYTNNVYDVDLSDPKSVPRPATEKEWEDGTMIPDSRESNGKTFANQRFLTNAQPLPFRGFLFAKSGDIWSGDWARLSPDHSWIVLLSSSGSVHSSHESQIELGFGRDKGKLFMDVYNVDTGKKLVTIVGTYLNINPAALDQALWVTERYFMLPLGEHRERCLVCDFGRAGRNGGFKP
jgi:hypothetical protein